MSMLGPRPLPRKKFLIVADLDYTHFDHSKKEVVWMGSKDFWMDIYRHIFRMAKAQQIDLLFAIVTNKPSFDDICVVASREFSGLLQLNSFSSAFTYIKISGEDYCLVSQQGETLYECIQEDKNVVAVDKNLLPHFIIEEGAKKSKHIKILAAHYDIALENCLMLDDTPMVLEDMDSNGISSVGFQCFNPDEIGDIKLLDDRNYVSANLIKKREEIFLAVGNILHRIVAKQREQSVSLQLLAPIPQRSFTPQFLRPQSQQRSAFRIINTAPVCATSSSASQNEPMRPELEQSTTSVGYEDDPNSCIYSWGSTERLFGDVLKRFTK